MNAHQRRKFACWKHMTMPLGSEVIVYGRPATVFKHDSRRPNRCIVKFTDTDHPHDTQWVTIARVKPVKRLKVRPWWRGVHQEEIRNGQSNTNRSVVQAVSAGVDA
jgi:hypothetical protein